MNVIFTISVHYSIGRAVSMKEEKDIIKNIKNKEEDLKEGKSKGR